MSRVSGSTCGFLSDRRQPVSHWLINIASLGHSRWELASKSAMPSFQHLTPASNKLGGLRLRGLGCGFLMRASVVRHTDGHLFRTARARVTFCRMSFAFAVQMKGLGF